MPYLGDYLGLLLSEIAIARSQVDLESIRIAETYASHDLLKHFSIPHFKLPNVTLDIPFVVQEMEEIPNGKHPRGSLEKEKIKPIFENQLTLLTNEFNLNLTEEIIKQIQKKIDLLLDEHLLIPEVSISIRSLVNKMVIISVRELKIKKRGKEIKDPKEVELINEFEKKLKISLFANILSSRKPPPRLKVLVTTKELREIGRTDALPTIHLSISEESVEWVTIEKDDMSIEKLVPE